MGIRVAILASWLFPLLGFHFLCVVQGNLGILRIILYLSEAGRGIEAWPPEPHSNPRLAPTTRVTQYPPRQPSPLGQGGGGFFSLQQPCACHLVGDASSS